MATGSSTSAFVSTLIFNLIIFGIFIGIFLLLRNKYFNVYRPRSVNKAVPEHLRPTPLAESPFTWIVDLLSKPRPYIIQQTGVDGYFFLRYLRLFAFIGVTSGLIIWPILFAVSASGGGNKTGFDIISYANNTHKWRTFAYLFCSWVFFGFIMYAIWSELIFYTSFRHALQCSRFYSTLPSSRILLIDNVDQGLLFEDTIKQLFPSATRIRLTRNTKELTEAWTKREKLWGKLEAGFTKTITKCVKIRNKAEKKISQGKEAQIPTPQNEVLSYMPEKKLPGYKYKFYHFKSKNTFTDGIAEMKEFNGQIDEAKVGYPDNFEEKVGSVFIEFGSHLELQRAYQAVPHSQYFKLSRRYQSFLPDEVIWKNVGNDFKTRASKKAGAITFLTLMIIYWAIPVAVVGCISNINYLTDKVPFLRFIDNMPSVLMGIITGVVPTLALAFLMSLVPPVIKCMGRKSGCLTVQELDRWTQQWYFAFQVIQVFLVVTCTSAASSTVSAIIDDPTSALSLLAENLPPASNFYICYMILQGLSISSGILAQIMGLFLSFFLGRLLDKTPRQIWNRRSSLSDPDWGTQYARYGIFTVIMLCYAIISPIIIAFTVIAYWLIYLAMLYNLVYVSGHSRDNRGRNYPLALFQVFVGLYLAEICLIGLFVMQKNWACVVLESVFLAGTVLVHLYFRRVFEPILDTVPIGAIKEASGGETGAYPTQDLGLKQVEEEGEHYFVDEDTLYDAKKTEESPISSLQTPKKGSIADTEVVIDKNLPIPDSYDTTLTPGGIVESLKRFFMPKKYIDFAYKKGMMPNFWSEPVDPESIKNLKYETPEIADRKPIVWIPRDYLGISSSIVDMCKEGGFVATDDNAIVTDKGKVEVLGEPAEFEPRLSY